MKVLVIGATGSFAGLVVPELKKRGVTVRALVRADDRVSETRRRGANETVLGDDQFGLPGANALVPRAIRGRKPRTVDDFLRELAGASIAQVAAAQ